MLQGRFANRSGRLWAYRRNSDALFETTPGKLFVEGHLYSAIRDDGSKDAALEHDFSELESAATPLLDRFVDAARRGQTPTIALEERRLWDTFLYFQMKRVPEFHRAEVMTKTLADNIASARNELVERFPHRRGEIDGLIDGAAGKRLIQNARIKAIAAASPLIMEAFSRRKLCVIKVAETAGKSFILGSSPVARMGADGLSNSKAELWLPIAPDVVAGIGPFGIGAIFATLSDRDAVRRINLTIAKQSDTFASASRDLVRSLVKPR